MTTRTAKRWLVGGCSACPKTPEGALVLRAVHAHHAFLRTLRIECATKCNNCTYTHPVVTANAGVANAGVTVVVCIYLGKFSPHDGETPPPN